jgi:ribosomal protein L40E
LEVANNIQEKQYIGESENDIEEDVKLLQNSLEDFEEEDLDYLKVCPKCMSENLNLKYYSKGTKGTKFYKNDVPEFLEEEEIWDVSETKQFYTLNRNVILVHCRECHYNWWEIPHDER